MGVEGGAKATAGTKVAEIAGGVEVAGTAGTAEAVEAAVSAGAAAVPAGAAVLPSLALANRAEALPRRGNGVWPTATVSDSSTYTLAWLRERARPDPGGVKRSSAAR